ncbi:MAG TPA: hypothetical protein VKG84_09495 [Candidatus Acidoferrales bacterium]|nr:hypothetical protein [Candidatus Acidoferrales bacterium]
MQFKGQGGTLMHPAHQGSGELRRLLFVLLATSCLSLGSAFSREPSSEGKVIAIEQYCSEMERLTGTEPDFILGVAGSSANPSGEWRRYSSKDELHKAWQHSGDRSLGAYVWLRNGELVRTNFTLESESHDWVQYSGYCFRSGDLVKLNYELRTTYNQMLVRRERFYDAKGHVLKSSEEFLDLQTERPKRPSEAFADEATTIYHHVSDLPFWALVRRPSQ